MILLVSSDQDFLHTRMINEEHFYLDPSDVKPCSTCKTYVRSMNCDRWFVKGDHRNQYCSLVCAQTQIQDKLEKSPEASSSQTPHIYLGDFVKWTLHPEIDYIVVC